MARYEWFWDNYEKSMDWINHHEVTYWKSQATALKNENDCLRKSLCRAQKISSVKVPRKKNRKRHRKAGKKLVQKNVQEVTSASDLNVEVSPELIEFFRISIKHKADRKKEKEEREALAAFVPPQDVVDARISEMKALYGEGSARILELEQAMTLNYERFVDRKCPEYWPQVPFNVNSTC